MLFRAVPQDSRYSEQVVVYNAIERIKQRCPSEIRPGKRDICEYIGKRFHRLFESGLFSCLVWVRRFPLLVKGINGLLLVLHTLRSGDQELARQFNLEHSCNALFAEYPVFTPKLEIGES